MKTSLLPVLLAACPLAGQAVSVTVSAATALTSRAAGGSTNDVQTVPIGPLPPSGGVLAQVMSLPTSSSASMYLSWQTTLPAQHERLTVGCGFLGWANTPAATASASVDPFELLLHIQAPTPRRVLIAGNVIVAVSPGQPAPQCEIDLFDDGSSEWGTTVSQLPVSVLVGPTPIPIRIRGTISVLQNGIAQGAAGIEITPDNRIDVYTMVQGCLVDGWLRFEEAFAHDGVSLRVPAGNLCVAVLGLGVQPVVLSAYGTFPCILLPSPDVLLVIPPTGIDLPIPAAARPIDIYAQAVWFEGTALPTTTGYRASAY